MKVCVFHEMDNKTRCCRLCCIGQAELDNRFNEEYQRRVPRHKSPSPADIFKLATKDAMIATFIQSWRHGNCSWEECLINIVANQQIRLEKLEEHYRLEMVREFTSSQAETSP